MKKHLRGESVALPSLNRLDLMAVPQTRFTLGLSRMSVLKNFYYQQQLQASKWPLFLRLFPMLLLCFHQHAKKDHLVSEEMPVNQLAYSGMRATPMSHRTAYVTRYEHTSDCLQRKTRNQRVHGCDSHITTITQVVFFKGTSMSTVPAGSAPVFI